MVGLGSMGLGMASSLLRAGHKTHGHDIDAARTAAFAVEGGTSGTLHALAPTLDGVVLVVLNAAQAEAVLFGEDGIAAALPEGAVVVNCATVAPAFAADTARRCEASGLHYLDAPVSGGAARAEAGELSVMASGTPEAFARARPLLDAMATTVFELGDAAGAGSALKAANQLLAGVHITAMAEAMTFALSQGVTPERFMEVIPLCAGTSWMLENRGPHVVEGDYHPRSRMTIWPKDLAIVREAAGPLADELRLLAAALERFETAVDAGLADEDDAAVARVYARAMGVALPGEER